jgi:hypothetical protein
MHLATLAGWWGSLYIRSTEVRFACRALVTCGARRATYSEHLKIAGKTLVAHQR